MKNNTYPNSDKIKISFKEACRNYIIGFNLALFQLIAFLYTFGYLLNYKSVISSAIFLTIFASIFFFVSYRYPIKFYFIFEK